MTTDQTPQLDLEAIEARATNERLTPGPWEVDREGCDCGGDYPCGHGMYVTGVVTPVPTWSAAERLQRTGEQPRDYDFHRGEIGDFTEADWQLMAHAREDVPALVAEVRRLRATVDRVRQLHDGLDAETALTSPDELITRGRAARKIAAALDGWTAPAPTVR
ncbi:hypothetical protein [Streptomyces sp. NPDC004230]